MKTGSEHKWNRIRLVEYSFAELLDPSEVPRFVRELIFNLVKEVKLINYASNARPIHQNIDFELKIRC